MLDALSIVEAAYAPAADNQSWLSNLAYSAQILDRGFGVCAGLYEVRAAGPSMSLAVASGTATAFPPAFLDSNVQRSAFAPFAAQYGERALRRVFSTRPTVGGLSQLTGAPTEAIHRVLAAADAAWARGKRDLVSFQAGDPSGYGCALFAVAPRRVHMTPRVQQLFTRVAVHVAHAYRLHRTKADTVDAVLEPDGRIEHIETSHVTKEDSVALAGAARRIDRARGALRRKSPDEALAIWRGLVDGRWTLVDHVDHDGRRYVFARRNAPVVHGWARLTERERQVVAYAAHGHPQKLIAYQLGIAASTVGHHLTSAARKLRFDSRIALLAAYRQSHTNGRIET